jgi:mono/diheme cytochrome c family protein
MRIFSRKFVASLVLFSAAPVLQVNAQPTLPEMNGGQLFYRFCASCHGIAGIGDGPVAPHLKVQVPDLTRLSQRAGGSFPAERVREIIDGRAVLPEHGTRPMPVWGYELEAQTPADQSGREVAQSVIDKLVEYLGSIQR